jgi:hypothetical protein
VSNLQPQEEYIFLPGKEKEKLYRKPASVQELVPAIYVTLKFQEKQIVYSCRQTQQYI